VDAAVEHELADDAVARGGHRGVDDRTVGGLLPCAAPWSRGVHSGRRTIRISIAALIGGANPPDPSEATVAFLKAAQRRAITVACLSTDLIPGLMYDIGGGVPATEAQVHGGEGEHRIKVCL
jgi:hypothetical protein